MDETQRTTELCVLGTEAEAMAMAIELRENGITPVVVRTASEAFPGVVDRTGWGTLRVAESELERAREVLEAWYAREDEDVDEDELERQALEAAGKSEEERHREVASLAPPYRGPGRPTRDEPSAASPSRPVRVSTIVAGASIALNVGLGAWILEKSDEERPAGDAIEYELSDLEGDVIDFDPIDDTMDDDEGAFYAYEHDAQGHRRTESLWEEGRANPSSTIFFDVHGTRTSEVVDRDDDGREERISSYDRDGRLTVRQLDTDEDGRDERLETYDRQGRVASELLDEDEDGRWDETRVHAGEGRESLLLRDADGDGHFESLICDGEPRAIRCP